MISTATTLLTLILFSSGLSESTVPVLDRSERSAPIRITGVLIPAGSTDNSPSTECTVRLSLRNVSDKPIILYVLEVEVAHATGCSEWHRTQSHDDFFSEHQLEVDATTQMELTHRSPQTSAATDSGEQNPEATAAIQFVQFADGTTWGDSGVGSTMFEMRRKSLRNLKELSERYKTMSDSEFERLLTSSSSSDAAMARLNWIYIHSQDMGAVGEALNKMISFAEANERKIQNSPK